MIRWDIVGASWFNVMKDASRHGHYRARRTLAVCADSAEG